MALVLDTGPLLAAINPNDKDHLRCRALLEQTTEPMLIPVPVLAEVDYFVCKYMQASVFVRVLDDILAGAFSVVDLVPSDYPRVREVCDRYADAKVGFTDASVLAIVERLKEPKVASLDHGHFRMLRPRHVPALHLLPD